jgi:hypothetical protein
VKATYQGIIENQYSFPPTPTISSEPHQIDPYAENATGPFNHTLTDTDLGGLTLFPGVYKFDAAAPIHILDLYIDIDMRQMPVTYC